MMKIHNIGDLRREQRVVEQRRLQLEKELHRDWNDLKHDTTPPGNSFFRLSGRRNAMILLYQGLSLGAGVILKKFGGKIGSKIDSWLN